MKYLFQNAELRKLIIDLNTIEQLYNEGIDSKGVRLGDYTTYTKSIKQSKGQRIDHITLSDTGDFYETFKVILDGNAIRITANPFKEDTNLFKEFGFDILGLTEDSMSVVATQALRLIKIKLRDVL